MSNEKPSPRADEKALLAMRADLDRLRVALAVRDIRALVGPSGADRLEGLRPFAATFVRLAGPALGGARLARWVRIASLAMVAGRVVRNWKRRR